ncbi:RseA family anti-sigma factor [Porticoccus sp. W117]|uniref:sigma-E factor negative regulatory protein n=1 Tax=Porticoccus sp. W117 TaxID=3054777 RepID=UPI002594E416|nr:RseA family anti-sigma factor [Porticoccus sp. W117]MDM3869830.1 RseA family anti-sigma factor [Porticoccus sp. W117]
MSDHDNRLRESLSALMDDSADELELQRVLKAAADDDELRNTWERYQLARSALRNDVPARTMDLSASVAAAIDSEPAHKATGGAMKTLGRVAIAASVTLAIVIGVQQFNQPGNPAGSAEIAANNDAVPPVTNEFSQPIPTAPVGYGELVVEPPSELDDTAKKELEERLNELMNQHTDDASLNGGQGLIPHARLPETKPEEGQNSGK